MGVLETQSIDWPQDFLIGASTAAHQVEGNNVNSDFWAMEQMDFSDFAEPSLDAVDHYRRFREDIDLMTEARLNAYRFSIEWARIEPVKGQYDEKEIQHYKEVLIYCRTKGVEPIVTMHHFSSPKWLIEEGGWENPAVIGAFKNYCVHVVHAIGNLMTYVCTINEANMGLALNVIKRSPVMGENANLQVGVNLENKANEDFLNRQKENYRRIFGTMKPETFLEMRSREGDLIIIEAHKAARNAMKELRPELKIGVTLSLHDFQAMEGGEENVKKEWFDEFLHYLPYIKEDDFIGIQNYTRKLVGPDGFVPAPAGAERTQMRYEYYPKALENVIRKVSEDLHIPIFVTENGIGTGDDTKRIAFITEAVSGIAACVKCGILVLGYLHWSLLDNFEWHKGYACTFGLIAVDRQTKQRTPKESLYYLGNVIGKRRSF